MRKRASEKKPGRIGTEKNYFTARVSKEVERRFRAAIPEGFGFGESVEAALRTWTDLAEPVRMETLIRRTSNAFDAIVEQIVDRVIKDGLRSGRLLLDIQPEKPAETDRDSHADNAGPPR
jgi:hypothetical protein